MVFPKGWGGLDATSGHVALLKNWTAQRSDGKPGWKVTIRGANQSYSNYGTWPDGYWFEKGCANVTDTNLKTIVLEDDLQKGSEKGGVSLYVPVNPRW